MIKSQIKPLGKLDWPQLRYHEIQYKVWFSPKRFLYIPAGRQSGKTELSLRRIVRHLRLKKPWPDPRFIYAAPTFMQAKRIAWRRLLTLIPAYWISDVSKSELRIETIFGSTIQLIGLDQPQRAEGDIGGIDGIIVDESSDIKPETWSRSILETLMHRHGWAWHIGVPKRYGIGAVVFKTNFFKALAGELPETAAFTWPSSGVVPAKEVELARSILDPYDFEEQFEAKWLTAGGGIFHSFDKEYNVRPCNYDENKPILVGSDFNVDPMCWVMCHLRGDILEVFDELHIRNTNTVSALKVLLSRYANHKGGFQMYGDASSRGRSTSAFLTDYVHIANNMILKRMGRTMHYLRSNPPIADRFATMNARICSGDGTMNVFVAPHCKRLIMDLETRTYKPNTRTPADAPDQGHMTDALGYLMYRKWSLRLRIPGGGGKVYISRG